MAKTLKHDVTSKFKSGQWNRSDEYARRGLLKVWDNHLQEIITYGQQVTEDLREIVLNAGVELTNEERYGGWSDDSDF